MCHIIIVLPKSQLFVSIASAIFRVLGAKIGKQTSIPNLKARAGINLLELGDNVMFGGGVRPETFYRSGSSVIFKRVCIESSVTIGHAALIGPGAHICHSVQLGAVAVVAPDQMLQQGHVYMGAPTISLGRVRGDRAISDLHGVFETVNDRFSDWKLPSGLMQLAILTMQSFTAH